MYSELNPGSERYAELGTLEEKNLLEFARQIAAGMVQKNLKARHLSYFWPFVDDYRFQV